MFKKILCFFLAVSLAVCLVCPTAFADDATSEHTHDWVDLTPALKIEGKVHDLECSVSVKQCSICKFYDHKISLAGYTYDYIAATASPGFEGILQNLAMKLYASIFGNNSAATKAPSGVGRKDLPGYCDTGDGTSTPQVDSNGKFVDGWVYVTPEHDYSYISPGYGGYYAGCEHYTHTITNKLNASFTCSSLPFLAAYSNSSSGFTNGYFGNRFYFYWKVNVPAYSYVRFLSFGQYTFNSVLSGKTTTTKNTFSNSRALNTEYYMGSETIFFFDEFGYFSNQTYFSATYSALPVIQYKPPQFNNISYNTNLTINKNTWNGNIYTDNSTNLTYIYPQYTTVNEKNETVTNISNTPIIYNNETKQYYTYDTVTNNYYYITYETTPTPTPSPSPAPVPTWTPGGGATRGGGVGRHPSDTDAADWTLHYYILNNRRYDAYYALKKTEVDTDTKLPWVDNKKYISTTQIPIANGQYTVSVPDGVYWRVWSWDEASQTLTGVNSSNWHSTINNFLFNATGEYIFEFCKADGSDFNTAKDVTLKLKNDKITDYEDGGTIVEEPTPSPSPEPTETPSPSEAPTPTVTPNPGGGTVPTPGGDSGGNGSGVSGGDGEGLFGWIWDLLKDIVKSILKAIFKIIANILGFLIWIVERVGLLLPFLPGPAVAALGAGVVLVFVIRIIRFIRG